MRLGKVELSLSYIVDLDDDLMVSSAREALYEDVMNLVKYDEFYDYIDVSEENPKLKESDIPEFLRENWEFTS